MNLFLRLSETTVNNRMTHSAIAGQNVFHLGGGGWQLGRARCGEVQANTPKKIFEIFIPEFKLLQMHQIIKSISYIWGTHL